MCSKLRDVPDMRRAGAKDDTVRRKIASRLGKGLLMRHADGGSKSYFGHSSLRLRPFT